MNPQLAVVAVAFITITAIIARTVVKIVNMRMAAGSSDELTSRVEELEGTVHSLQQELAEAQERLDFAERLLSKGSHSS